MKALIIIAAVISFTACLPGSPEPQETPLQDSIVIDTIKKDSIATDTLFPND